MNVTIITAIVGVIWWFAVAAYWQRRCRKATREALYYQARWEGTVKRYCELSDEYVALVEARGSASQPAHMRRPTLRFSRLDGEPGKVFGSEVVDGVGYIWSEN